MAPSWFCAGVGATGLVSFGAARSGLGATRSGCCFRWFGSLGLCHDGCGPGSGAGCLLRGAPPLTWGGPLLAGERSSFAAEFHALYLLLTALAAGVAASGWSGPIFCVLDSKAVLAVLDRPSAPLERWERWSRVRTASDCLRASRCTLSLSWVPSHGRVVPSWSLPWQVPKSLARELNAAPDAIAGRVHGLAPVFRPLRAHAQRRAEALRWQASALAAARAVMRAYLSSLRTDAVARL